jgi:sporulation protein YlmC with PRC-barrel domain
MSADMNEPVYIQMETIRAIRDSRVYDKNGEKLGKIDDLLIDRENNRVACAVFSFGSYLLGLGNQYFVIPLEAFKNGQHREDYVLDVDKVTLENEEGFRYEPLTQMKLSEAYMQYKVKPYWEK